MAGTGPAMTERPRPETRAAALKPAQRDFLDPVVGGLAEDEAGAIAGRQDVFAEVRQVDAAPQPLRHLPRLDLRHLGIFAEIALRVAERGGAQAHEALDIPLADHRLVRVDIDREVE